MDTRRSSDDERRAYWKEQMDGAYDFMLEIQRYPIEECDEPLAPLREAADQAGVKVLFSELPHARGLPRMFLLREGLIADFLSAAREMNDRGWVLKVEDGYRSRLMQKYNALRPEVFPFVLSKVKWELGGRMPSLDLVRRRLAAMIAMNPKVGTHCSGSAIDVSVFTLGGAEIDRGAPYLEISEKTPMGSPFVPEEARRNRAEITDLMGRHGFFTYHFEFWHYNKDDAYAEYLLGNRRPARYGPVDLDPATGAVTAIPDSTAPLNSEKEIGAMIEQAIREGRAEGAEG